MEIAYTRVDIERVGKQRDLFVKITSAAVSMQDLTQSGYFSNY